MNMARTGTFSGRVTEIDIGGTGPNSGQLEFAVTPDGGGVSMTFVVEMDTEARVFTVMATLLTMAYRASLPVTVEYQVIEGAAPKAINIRLPATD
jgi:hypothetical protein